MEYEEKAQEFAESMLSLIQARKEVRAATQEQSNNFCSYGERKEK